MKMWALDIENKKLKHIYDSYLFRQNEQLTFYLSAVVVSQHANFPKSALAFQVKASHDFDESATSIRTVAEVVELVKNGKYDQLARSFAILGIVTTFCDFFDEIKNLLNIPVPELKKPIELNIQSEGLFKIKPASLKIANYVNNKYLLDARIGDIYPLRWINCIINLRHMFVHNSGVFDKLYSSEMFASWSNLKENDPILFDENQVDSILWFLNDHVSDFSRRLDRNLQQAN